MSANLEKMFGDAQAELKAAVRPIESKYYGLMEAEGNRHEKEMDSLRAAMHSETQPHKDKAERIFAQYRAARSAAYTVAHPTAEQQLAKMRAALFNLVYCMQRHKEQGHFVAMDGKYFDDARALLGAKK